MPRSDRRFPAGHSPPKHRIGAQGDRRRCAVLALPAIGNGGPPAVHPWTVAGLSGDHQNGVSIHQCTCGAAAAFHRQRAGRTMALKPDNRCAEEQGLERRLPAS